MTQETLEIYKDYLKELTFNSKPLINSLSKLANANREYAEGIVHVIEDHILKVPAKQKLPCLYLMDSIIKNLKEAEYKEYFEKNIADIFSGVFEKVDLKTRGKMYKLRLTWKNIFQKEVLHLLDQKIHLLDKAWPIVSLKSGQTSQTKERKVEPLVDITKDPRKQQNLDPAVNLPSKQQINTRDLKMQDNSSRKVSQPIDATRDPRRKRKTSPQVAENEKDILDKVLVNNILPTINSTELPAKKQKLEDSVIMEAPLEIPNLANPKTKELNMAPDKAVERMYEGTPCSNCGSRFLNTEMDEYREHLDWHFRQNNKDVKLNLTKKWYYSFGDWIQFENVYNDSQQSVDICGKAGPADNENTNLRALNDPTTQNPVASANAYENICFVCREQLEQFWNEDEEEWHLKDAVKVGKKKCHRMCYINAKESELQTPTPIKDMKSPPVFPKPPRNQSQEDIQKMISNPLAYLTSLNENLKGDGRDSPQFEIANLAVPLTSLMDV